MNRHIFDIALERWRNGDQDAATMASRAFFPFGANERAVFLHSASGIVSAFRTREDERARRLVRASFRRHGIDVDQEADFVDAVTRAILADDALWMVLERS